MENATLELHESRLVRVCAAGADVILDLAAYVRRSRGRPAEDEGTLWKQPATLTLTGASISRCPADAHLSIRDGVVVVDEVELDNVVPVPLDVCGAVRVVLAGSDGDVFEATGNGVRLLLHGEPMPADSRE